MKFEAMFIHYIKSLVVFGVISPAIHTLRVNGELQWTIDIVVRTKTDNKWQFSNLVDATCHKDYCPKMFQFQFQFQFQFSF